MSPSPTPSVAGQCASVFPPTLAYPSPGATGINSGLLQLWFFYPRDPSITFDPPVLTPSNSSASLQGSPYASPSPGPTPPGLPATPAGEQIFVSQFSLVAAATTYAVTVNNIMCGPDNLGSFTTR